MTKCPFKLGAWVKGATDMGEPIQGLYAGNDRDYGVLPGQSVIESYDENGRAAGLRVVKTATLEKVDP